MLTKAIKPDQQCLPFVSAPKMLLPPTNQPELLFTIQLITEVAGQRHRLDRRWRDGLKPLLEIVGNGSPDPHMFQKRPW